MENGGMEWEEIYGTNPSRVLKTLVSAAPAAAAAAAAATTTSLPPSRPTKIQREGGRPANPVRLPKKSVTAHLAKVFSLLETMRTWTPLTPCGGF